jgi:cell surface protein SprA
MAIRLASIREEAGNYVPYPSLSSDEADRFPSGYGKLNQEVLIYSFLAAYTGITPETIGLNTFPMIPMPNWQVTYDGLAKLKPFQKYLRTFTLRHGYRSTYTIGSYTTNLNFDPQEDGFSYIRDMNSNFIPEYEITNVSINEQFNPLIGLDATWINSLTNRLEIKNSRSLAMSFANNQLSEVSNWEYIIGSGYRFENLPLIFRSAGGDQRTLRSDLRVNVDLSIRNNNTILRRLVEETNTPSAGQQVFTIKTSGEYVVSEQVTIRLFFDRVVNTPVVATSYATANTSFGFSVRFTLVQ